jgi:SRSO17 transposase
MDLADFEAVAAAFSTFHRRFAPLFGREEAWVRSEQYLRGLLVQQTDRRNAENIAEVIDGASPRALQLFLSRSPWPTAPLIARLQTYLAEFLAAADGVLVVDDTGFAKQGRQSVGVARQYSGTLGKVGNCQIGVFLGYVSARGHALIDGALYLSREWTDDPARCAAAGVPPRTGYRSKAEIAFAQLQTARRTGALAAEWVTADAGYGEVPTFRDALDADGWRYVLEVPSTTPVFTALAETLVPPWSGRGRKPTRRVLAPGAPPRQPIVTVAAALGAADWTELTVAEGAQGPRTYQFAARRGWESRDGLPGRETWLLFRRNLDGSELKSYLSNAPADTPLAEVARVASWRWPIETGFEEAKGETGLDEYEVRSWVGWHHHMTLALLAGAFLLTVRQEVGKKSAGRDHPADHSPAPGPAPAADVDARRPVALAVRNAAAECLRQALPCAAPSPPSPGPTH